MTSALIDIVIPTYNRAWALGRAVESVLAQTMVDWRLTVVDDGSTDQTPELVASFDDPRLQYVVQPHSGVSAARNNGFGRRDSRWVAFLDSDDSWMADKLERQLEALEARPEYRVVYTNEVWIRNGVRVNQKRRHQKYSGWIFDRCLALCIISPSSILMSRRVLEDEGGFDTDLPVCEDYDLWLRLSRHMPVLFLDQLLITKYGGHQDQLSQSRWGLDLYRLRALEKLWLSDTLTYQQRCWTVAEALRKAAIVVAGFKKRDKTEETAHWAGVLHTWQGRTAGAEGGSG